MELLAGGLAAVEDGVVAHLAVGDGLVDLPAAAHLAVEIAFGLNALGIVLVDEADLRGAAHAAGNDVFADDVGDVQKVDGAQQGALAVVAQTCGADDAVDLVQHRHHRLIAAGRAAEDLEALAARADGIVFDDDAADAAVFLIGENLEVVVDGLRPALLGIADGEGDGIAGEGKVRVLQALVRGARGVCLVDDLKVGANFGELFGIVLEYAHAHAAADHQKIEQIVEGVEIVDDLKGAVVVGHGIGLGHGRGAHPQRAAGEELAQVEDVVVELLRLLARGGGEGAVVLHGAAHRFPPELAAVERGDIARIGARIDERAQFAHGAGGVLVRGEEFAGEQPLLPLHAAARLFLVHAVEDVCLGGGEMILLKERFLHRVLNGLDVHDALIALCQRLFHAVHHGFDVHIVFAGGRRRQRHGADDELAVVIDDVAVALPHLHGSLLLFVSP